MRTSQRVAALAIIAVLGAMLSVKAGQGNPPQPPASSNTRNAECIVKITVDPDVLALNGETVRALLHSPAVAGKAAREVLGSESPQDLSNVISIRWVRPDEPARGLQPPFVPSLYQPPVLMSMDEPNRPQEPDAPSNPETPGPGAPMYSLGGGIPGAGPYSVAPSLQIGRPVVQGVTFGLVVRLPDDAKPVARELMTAVVNNLRECLNEAYRTRERDLEALLSSAETRRHLATAKLRGDDRSVSREDAMVNEQLDRMVDLTGWTPETPLQEAISFIKVAANPPFNLIVLWADLREHLGIEPSMPIELDSLPRVRLRTALDLLVEALPRDDVKVVWTVRDGVVIIGTTATLTQPGQLPQGPAVEIDVRTLMTQRNDLTRKLQGLEVEMASMDARRQAIAREIDRIRQEAGEKLANDPVTKELESIVEANKGYLGQIKNQVDAGRAPMTDLAQANEKLTRAKIDLAKRREELAREVGGGQLEAFTAEMVRMTVDNAEKQAQMAILRRQLDQTQAHLARVPRVDPDATRTRAMREAIDVMDRQIAEFQMRVATLQAPTVTVVGAD